jgi:hypothetical protein
MVIYRSRLLLVIERARGASAAYLWGLTLDPSAAVGFGVVTSRGAGGILRMTFSHPKRVATRWRT